MDAGCSALAIKKESGKQQSLPIFSVKLPSTADTAIGTVFIPYATVLE